MSKTMASSAKNKNRGEAGELLVCSKLYEIFCEDEGLEVHQRRLGNKSVDLMLYSKKLKNPVSIQVKCCFQSAKNPHIVTGIFHRKKDGSSAYKEKSSSDPDFWICVFKADGNYRKIDRFFILSHEEIKQLQKDAFEKHGVPKDEWESCKGVPQICLDEFEKSDSENNWDKLFSTQN